MTRDEVLAWARECGIVKLLHDGDRVVGLPADRQERARPLPHAVEIAALRWRLIGFELRGDARPQAVARVDRRG
jgi:hypothetical protein